MRLWSNYSGGNAGRLLSTIIVFFALFSAAAAQNGTWINTTDAQWESPGSWQGGIIASGANNTANFNTLNIVDQGAGAGHTVGVGMTDPREIGHMIFGDTNTATPGIWEVYGTATVTMAGTNPSITVNPLGVIDTGSGLLDSVIFRPNLAGTSGLTKFGGGILTLAAGATHTITGGININAGELRADAALPVQAVSMANGTTFTSSGTVGAVSVAGGGTATFTYTGTAAGSIGSISSPGAGGTLNVNMTTNAQVSPGGTWTGFGTVNLTGTTVGTQAVFRPSPNNSFGGAPPTGFNVASYATSHVHMDNVRMLVRTNSQGNTMQIGELSGTSTATLAGGNAGSAARYTIGGNNTSSTFSGTIDGTGGITINKVGTGTLTLAGPIMGDATNNSLAIVNSPGRQGGVVRVTAGTLAITGATAIPGGFGTTLTTIDVLSGATFNVSGAPGTFTTSPLQKLQGNGTVVGSYNHANGFIRPGDIASTVPANEDNLSAGVVPTAGTISFNGNLQLSGGAIVYDMSLNPASGNDLIQVTGQANVTGGSIVPNFFNGIPSSGTYTVLTSTGGITGNINSLSVNFPGRGIDPIPFIDGNSIKFTAQPGGGSANLVWTGTNSSAWDIETTQNWNNGGSPDVYFDLDTVSFTEAAGNKTVTIGTAVAPSGTVTINNTSPYSFTGGGAIIGPAGLTKTGSGNLTMQVANTFAGPASLSGGGTVDIANFGGAFGTGVLTLGGTTIVTNNGLGFTNSSIDVAAATTNTIQGNGAVGSGNTVTVSNITGSGTLNINSTVADKWFALNGTAAFTGTVNMTGLDGQTNNTIRLTTTGGGTTFPGAVVNLNDVTLGNRQGGAAGTTTTFAFGELHGDAQSVLNAFIGGGTHINANWEIGALNTNSDFAGTIVDDAATNPVGRSLVTKVGTGTLTLTGANTYTGDTAILGGTLSINSPYLADTADVVLSSTATFNLDFPGGTDDIRSLYIDGVPAAVGTWGSPLSSATNKRNYFSGTGVLNVMSQVLVGDYNGNGVVDAADYVVWQNNVGAPSLTNRDPDNAGVIGAADLASWRANFGRSLTPAPGGGGHDPFGANVPEPSGLLLMLCGLGLAAARPARQRLGRR